MDSQVAEAIITGMTKGELAAVVCATITIFSLMIGALSYIMHLHLKPLKEIPGQLSDLNSKVKSGDELNLMMDNKILQHQVSCKNCGITNTAQDKDKKS